MNEVLVTREQEFIGQLKRKYTLMGYDFIEQPNEEQIPDFLSNALPDAIAKKGSEGIVFEVLLAGKSEKNSATANFLAREIPKHPGWKFELIVLDGSSVDDDANYDLGANDFKRELERVAKLVEGGDYKLAVVAGWALLESLKRFLTSNSKDKSVKRYKPSVVVEALVSEGLINDEEGENLRNIAYIRNKLVHGFVNVVVQKKDALFLNSIIETLIGFTKNER